MSLLSRFFYKRPPDGLLELSDRVYVFDSCFSTEALPEGIYRLYLHEIINDLHEEFPESSLLAFNFREGEKRSPFAEILCEYDVTVMDYPRQYEGCPLLPLSLIHHFLRVSESWLSMANCQNVVLLHCERGGWPLLAFVLASFLVFRKLHSGERKTLEMVYREGPRGLLQLLSPLNPFPSQLRYLQYISRRNISVEWPPPERPLSMDCLILRSIPRFDNQKGCRPIIRVYGRNLLSRDGLSTQMLYSMHKKGRHVRHYNQKESDVIKIDIQCLVQGDVVLECLHLDLEPEREVMMFRVMFNTAFIRSNILILTCENLDTMWESKSRFPKGFRAEVLFGDVENSSPVKAHTAMLNGEERGGLPIEAFSKVHELFNGGDWADSNDEAALWLFKHLSMLNDVKDLTMLKSRISGYSSPIDSEEENNTSSVADSLEFLESEKSAVHEFHILEDRSSMDSALEEVSDLRLSEDLVKPAVMPSISPTESTTTLEISSEASSDRQCHSLDWGELPQIAESSTLEISSDSSPLLKSMHSFNDPTISQSPSEPLASQPPLNLISSPSVQPLHSLQPPPPRPPPPPPPPPASGCHSAPQPPLRPPSVCHSAPPPPPPPPPPSVSHSVPPPPPPPPPSGFHSVPPPPPSSCLSVPPRSPSSCHSAAPPPPPPPPLPPGHVSRPPLSPPPPPHPPSFDSSSPAISNPSTPQVLSAAPTPPPPPPPPRVVNSAPPPPPPPLPPGRSFVAASPASAPVPPPPPPLPNNGFTLPPPVRGPPPAPPIGHGPPPRPPPPPPGLVPIPPVQPVVRSRSPTPPPIPPGGSSAPTPPPPPGRGVAPSAPPPPPSHPSGPNKQPAPGGKTSNAPPPPSLGRGRGLASARGRGSTGSSIPPKKTSLKPLHWVKVTRAVQGSLWADTQKQDSQSKAPEIDMSELESLFSLASAPDSGNKGGGSRGAKVNKPEKVQLVDLRKAYNCEIMLTKIKIPLPDMLTAILTLDSSALDIDQVENIIKFCPTKEEIETLKNYKGDKEMLGKCEQFFLELMKVPRVESKLRVFAFTINFTCQFEDLKRNLNTINDASTEVKESVKLRQIMQTILTLGNALNQGTARGSAVGFKLDSLLKLSDTRARNNKMTLMHYLCKIISEKMPELLDFSKDLVHLEPASKIQLKSLAEEMQAVSKGLEKIEQELTASENDGDVSAGFRKVLKSFLDTAEDEVRSLISLYKEVGRSADSLSEYFGEDPARCPFEQVTQTLVVFTKMFHKSHEENEQQADAEKKKLEKEALKEQQAVANSPARKEGIDALRAKLNSRGQKQAS